MNNLERRAKIGKQLDAAQNSMARIRRHGILGNLDRGLLVADSDLPQVDRDAVQRIKQDIDALRRTLDQGPPFIGFRFDG